ncbi:MAG: hypothetical protein KQH53_07730 [Desulfarculaceae bacterium]|nr:hypothetical protein [Desulfarculaceae bacterium]
MNKKLFALWVCLALAGMACASTSPKTGTLGTGSEHVNLNPPATFYLELASVPDDSPIYMIWDDYFATVPGLLKPPPLEKVVIRKVTAAMSYRGLVPKPRGQASLRVVASFDAKAPANRIGDESKKSQEIKYKIRFSLAVFKAEGGTKPAWRGWCTSVAPFDHVLNALNIGVAAVVKHWGERANGGTRVNIPRDDPLYRLVSQTP